MSRPTPSSPPPPEPRGEHAAAGTDDGVGAGPTADDRLRANRGTIDALLAAADARADHPAAAVELLRAAASVAWLNHAGCFAHPGIEARLIRLGERHVGRPAGRAKPRRLAGGRERPTVLHVLTQAYDTGGHTRLVRRWIDADPHRQHRVVLTAQSAVPLPEVLRSLPSAGPGAAPSLTTLRGGPDALLSIAAQLQAEAEGADLIVLHHHPNDVVPVLAFGGAAARPPVAVLNHAEHWYWCGTAIADATLCYEAKGARLCRDRRGIDPSRLAVVPLPLDDTALSGELPDKRAAKVALGIDPDSVVFLTTARAGKFEAEGQPHLADLLAGFAASRHDVTVLAVGPDDTGPWLDARRRSGDRLRAVGMQHPLQPWLDAADVALESYPLGSTTALLEAVLAGAVPVTFRFDEDVVRLFTSDHFGPGHVMIDTPGELPTVLGHLADDGAERWALARRCREAIVARHGPDGFLAALEAGYRTIDGLDRQTAPTVDPQGADGSDRFLVRQLVAEGSALEDGAVETLLARIAVAPAPAELTVVLSGPADAPGAGDAEAQLRRELGASRVQWIDLERDANGDLSAAISRSNGAAVLIARRDLTGPTGWLGELLARLADDAHVQALLPIVQGEGRDPRVCLLVRGVPARAGAQLTFTDVDLVLCPAHQRRWTSLLTEPTWDADFEQLLVGYCQTFVAGDPVTMVLTDASALELGEQIRRLQEAISHSGVDPDALPDLVLSSRRAEPADNGVGAVLWLSDPRTAPVEGSTPVTARRPEELRRLIR